MARVGIVGAGVAGLITAHTLQQCGYDVTIYDEHDEVGGVWSSSRRYPGVTTQSPKDTYAFSSFPMPSHYPEFPSGEQVQAYLEAFARQAGLERCLRLGERVIKTEQVVSGWEITTSGVTELFDILIITTGTFSTPNIPDTPTDPSFSGTVLHTSQITSIDQLRGKDVLVLGYGRSACDIAVQAKRVARSTSLVFQRATWRFPRCIAGVVQYSYLLLTRFIGSPLLIPDEPIDSVGSSSIYLASDGLVDGINKGHVAVHHGASIERLEEGHARLTNEQRIPVDVAVCGTGWHQSVPPFLPVDLRKKLLSPEGDWLLYRHIKPPSSSNLFFNGFNYSLFCPLTFEISALWIAKCLQGMAIPIEEEQHRLALEEVRWMRTRTKGKHARGTSLVPFSMTYIDELLVDMDVGLSWWAKAKEWVLPINPRAYKGMVETGIGRIAYERSKTT